MVSNDNQKNEKCKPIYDLLKQKDKCFFLTFIWIENNIQSYLAMPYLYKIYVCLLLNKNFNIDNHLVVLGMTYGSILTKTRLNVKNFEHIVKNFVPNVKNDEPITLKIILCMRTLPTVIITNLTMEQNLTNLLWMYLSSVC